MRDDNEIISIIETDGGPISLKDMSYFFYHFRAAYVEALNTIELKENADIETFDLNQWARDVADNLSKKGHLGVSRNALAELPSSKELYFTDLSRVNPISFVFECVGVALAVAVIISGGEIKYDEKGFSAKLPPLGKGITELKKAIQGEFKPRKKDKK